MYPMIRILLILTLILYPMGVVARPGPKPANCKATEVRYTANTSYNTTFGIGGFDWQSLEGLESQWDKITIGDPRWGDCFEWVSTQSNFHLQWVCRDTFMIVTMQLNFRVNSASNSFLLFSFSSHNADVDMDISQLWPGEGAACDPCDKNIFTRIEHQAHLDADEGIDHEIRYELTRDRFVGALLFSSLATEPEMNIRKSSYISYRIDSCIRGLAP